MTTYTSRASYKKKDGMLSISDNRTTISWTPAGPGASPITIAITSVTNLQMTPATSPKCSVKIFAKPAKEGDPEFYVFQFTSANNARGEGEAFRDILSPLLQVTRSGTTPQPAAKGDASGTATPAGMVAAPQKKNVKPLWEDDQRLLKDIELQQSLLKANPALQKIFMEALSTKSNNITNTQFMSQFWSARLPLLRSHAFEKSQQRGTYNVLVSLKPRTENGATKLNISREQITLLFTQHPLVLRAYDECVPKIREEEFWSRFAQSRLFKKLRGERIADTDAVDAMLDKYLHVDPVRYQRSEAHLPHIIDLSGNEENHSQRQGNRPDIDMRPANLDKVPIIRTLNELSEKLMSNVAPSDIDPSAPSGMSEEEFDRRTLALRDLKDEQEIQRFVLKIRDQDALFSRGSAESQEMMVGPSDVDSKPTHDPLQLLKTLRSGMETHYPGDSGNLGALIEPAGADEDDDSDEEMTDGPIPKKQKSEAVGSKESMQLASSKILNLLRTRRAQEEVPTSDTNRAKGETFGLTKTIYDRVNLTHATSNEFLHQFWQAFLSGNPDRANELASLYESLVRALERIDSIARDAEQIRQTEIDRIKAHIKETYEATRKRLRINPEKTAPPGATTVKALLGPTRSALERAIQEYKRALEDAQAQSVALGVATAGGVVGATPISLSERSTPQPATAGDI
ncbi:RNA polymerase II transcription factor B subunit 1 [Ascosphaera aggregata]|nr:RNA polymerase II transcription factor B subunit 1 [Ascosphaera aggregata]